MVAFPPCKINLGLNVLSRRPDGYHDVSTCFYPLPWSDVLEVLPSPSLNFTHTGLNIPGKEEDNLCLKAYKLLKSDYDLTPIQLHLHKIIPMGAGLGGGSSDASHMLMLLDKLFSLGLSLTQLSGYASTLGSDCTFFLYDQPMLGNGRGEKLQGISLSLKGYYLILVKPHVHVSTSEAYSHVIAHQAAHSIQEIVSKPVGLWRKLLINDFEESVFQKHPLLKDVKDRLYGHGALYASMSGSGSSLFGIFDKEIDLTSQFRDELCWSGWL